MSEKDRCYTVVEELELELRMSQRVIEIYEEVISKTKELLFRSRNKGIKER